MTSSPRFVQHFLVPLVLALVLGAFEVIGGVTLAFALPMNPEPPSSLAQVELVDAHLGYRKQTGCSPLAKPGAKAVLKLLIDNWGGSSSGIARACGKGRVSEHKEGRALDWRMSVKNKSQKARVAKALKWLTANNGEVAYRLGIMYIIWDQKIWSIYYQEMGWRKMENRGSATANHKDHVHISLSWDGALMTTSWWTGVPMLTPHNYYWCGKLGKPACPSIISRGTAASSPIGQTVPPAFSPYPQKVPEIAGSPLVGWPLSVVEGTWVPEGSSLHYQWYRGKKAIKGATKATYWVARADVGKTIKVKVTAHTPDGESVSKTTESTTYAAKGKKWTPPPAPDPVPVSPVEPTPDLLTNIPG